jgi:hypothetical protein
MADLVVEKPAKAESKAEAKAPEQPQVYTQTSQGLCNDHARAMGELMTDAELLAHADNVARFLGIHRQADPKSRETALWSIRHKDLINSKQYKAAKP